MTETGLEHLPALLESIASIVGDKSLAADEREQMLGETFDQYKEFTGRDGLADIAAKSNGEADQGFNATGRGPMHDRLRDRYDDILRGNPRLSPEEVFARAWNTLRRAQRAAIREEEAAPAPEAEKKDQTMNYTDTGALAMFAIECAADVLRKANPSLTPEQAFAKAYQAPENRAAARAERQASRARLSGFNIARLQPEIIDPDDDAEIKRLINEERRKHPFLSNEQLFSRVYSSPEVTRARTAMRRAQDNARRAGTALPGPNGVEVEKRDCAFEELTTKAAELRKAQPSLTPEQAFAKAYVDPANRALAAQERRSARAALYAVV